MLLVLLVLQAVLAFAAAADLEPVVVDPAAVACAAVLMAVVAWGVSLELTTLLTHQQCPLVLGKTAFTKNKTTPHLQPWIETTSHSKTQQHRNKATAKQTTQPKDKGQTSRRKSTRRDKLLHYMDKFLRINFSRKLHGRLLVLQGRVFAN